MTRSAEPFPARTTLGGTIVDRDRWRTAIDFFLYRQFPSPIGGVDSYVYFDEDIPLQALE